MAQDPEDDDEQQVGDDGDSSHDLDMVTIYESLAVDAEMEADVIHGLLQANGVPSIVVRAAQYPNLGFELKVPRAHLARARQFIAEAQAAGPEAAAEAEAASESEPDR